MAIILTKRTVIYPGTFDPVTNGHLSLVERACSLFDDVVVAVAANAGKQPLFSWEERIDLVKSSLVDRVPADTVRILGFDGLLANFAIEQSACAIIRGLRAVSDFEYEFQMALMNRKLARDVEAVFLMPSLSWVYLSSTLVKDVAQHGGDIDELVPLPVKAALTQKFGQ